MICMQRSTRSEIMKYDFFYWPRAVDATKDPAAKKINVIALKSRGKAQTLFATFVPSSRWSIDRTALTSRRRHHYIENRITRESRQRVCSGYSTKLCIRRDY